MELYRINGQTKNINQIAQSIRNGDHIENIPYDICCLLLETIKRIKPNIQIDYLYDVEDCIILNVMEK